MLGALKDLNGLDMTTISVMLIILGACIFIIGFAGCFGALKESPFLLGLVCPEFALQSAIYIYFSKDILL